MGRFKVTKQDTFIDMTPMSDVMVLLLTFFMLTATFVKDEPVKVNTPGSVSDIKIPANNLLTIFVSPKGKVFLSMDSPQGMRSIAEQINADQEATVVSDIETFAQLPMFGTPMNVLNQWMKLENRNDLLNSNSPEAGIPCGSGEEGSLEKDELKIWVTAAREACGENMRIAIKADQRTPYKTIKNVMNSLRSIHENRYNLITSLKGADD